MLRPIKWLAAFLFAARLLHADSIPNFGDAARLADANVLRMKPPFETRYYFTFQTGRGRSATVIHDIYYDKKGYSRLRNRVFVREINHREFRIPRSGYAALYQSLP
ncbi:MAG TPA: hypothetical protein VIT23_11730, partial [Terrimicrobiaceae bacterium]